MRHRALFRLLLTLSLAWPGARALATRTGKATPLVRIRGTPLRFGPSSRVAHEGAYGEKWVRRMRTEWGTRLNPSAKVRRVLYPFSGLDAASVLSMFEGPHGGPDEVLMTDIQRFGTPGEVAVGHGQEKLKHTYFEAKVGKGFSPWQVIGPLGRTVGLGPPLLWELEHLGATAIRIAYLDGDGKAKRIAGGRITEEELQGLYRSRFDSRFAEPDLVEKFTVDPAERQIARVTFTLGGRARSITYVQQNLIDGSARAKVIDDFIAGGIDAYLEKANGTAQRDPRYLAFRANAMRSLAAGHGVFVSDYYEDHDPHNGSLGLKRKGWGAGFGWAHDGAGRFYSVDPEQADAAAHAGGATPPK